MLTGIQAKSFTMRPCSRGRASTLSSIVVVVINLLIKISLETTAQVASQNFKISPKPCVVGNVDGTCMFVLECIKSEGIHLGMCMDGFMFGSCCAHNLKDNFVLPPSTPFRPPNKPTNKYKPSKVPPSKPNKPSSNNQGTVTIKRPNGSGTLVIRQPQNQKPSKNRPTTAVTSTSRKPVTTKTKFTTTSTKSPLENFNDSSNELSASASVSASKCLNN